MRKGQVISRTKVQKVIDGTKGRFFHATFNKVNGDERKMLARLGVTKGLKGGENKVVKDSNDYLTVWDVQSKGYRTLNLGTLTALSADGIDYEVV